MTRERMPDDYPALLSALKSRIEAASVQAVRSISRETVLLYWDLGAAIVEKQSNAGWGDSVVERLSRDLVRAFPDVRGFSVQNLWRMRQFYLTHTSELFLSQAVRELGIEGDTEKLSQAVRELVADVPWGHHVNVLANVADPVARIYYLRGTVRLGWTRAVLMNQVKSRAYERAVTEKKTHNFPAALPENFAEQADEILKNRYDL